MIVKIEPTNQHKLTLHNSTLELSEAFAAVTLTKTPDGKVLFTPAFYLTEGDVIAAIGESKNKPRPQALNVPMMAEKLQSGQIGRYGIQVSPSEDTNDSILGAVNEWLSDKNFVFSYVNF
jgi:hypothetical protein